MTFLDRLTAFPPLDLAAIALLILAWYCVGLIIENPPKARQSVSQMMRDYRREWMMQMITRQPRIFDAAILDTLRQGTAFFASACMIAIGGGLALIANTDRLSGVAHDLAIESSSAIIYEFKILLVLAFLANALLKFVWSHRLFGYCAVVMAAVPNEIYNPMSKHRAEQAAQININAARSFNRGLRAIYFALGALGWLIGPIALIVATLITVAVLIRREFSSGARLTLMATTPTK